MGGYPIGMPNSPESEFMNTCLLFLAAMVAANTIHADLFYQEDFP